MRWQFPRLISRPRGASFDETTRPAVIIVAGQTGLPSSTAMTRWGGCCLSTGGAVSTCLASGARHPTACHFGSGA